MALYPYLFFGGDCREAFTRYQEVFGGQLDIMSMADAPPGEAPEGVSTDMVMHAALSWGDNLLMGSDDPSPDFGSPRGMAINVSVDEIDEAKRIFEALAEGGEVTMALAETFWAPMFGACVDRFGAHWMVNAEPPGESG